MIKCRVSFASVDHFIVCLNKILIVEQSVKIGRHQNQKLNFKGIMNGKKKKNKFLEMDLCPAGCHKFI